MNWRLLETGALPGSLNMAIDEAMLRLHERGLSPPTLRLYQWNPPAVSLGYFQRRHTLDLAACRRLGLDVVRRPTGGRAVLHMNDLTYSVVAGVQDGIPSSLAEAYSLLSKGLLAGLQLLGVAAEMGHERATPPQPEVCFLRSSAADIVHQGKKFLGSAQTWRGSSLLQHGSVVLEPQGEVLASIFGLLGGNPAEYEARMTSLSHILGRRPAAPQVKAALREGMARVLEVVFERGELSPEEWAEAGEIASQETAKDQWERHAGLFGLKAPQAGQARPGPGPG